MLRYLTAGESHGQALIATMEGIPAHVRVGVEEISTNLARRRLGVGRGARMKFEADEVTLLGGFRHGETLGSPIAIMVGNTLSDMEFGRNLGVHTVFLPTTRPEVAHDDARIDLVAGSLFEFAQMLDPDKF